VEPVAQDIVREFDLLYRPLGADAGRDELSVTDAEAEIGYYQGDGILLEDVLREQVLLALPLKVTCREDCKGLCLHCGKNLNEEQCSCTVIRKIRAGRRCGKFAASWNTEHRCQPSAFSRWRK
jgi:uncharacterized protein